MDAKTIKNMGRKLGTFLAEFDDCFSRTDQRRHLQTYINGQLSDLERKSIEPIALAANVPPRTLQYFLSSGRASCKTRLSRQFDGFDGTPNDCAESHKP